MICISIAQESRRMALADMLNAARQCDLLEVRLDRFEKNPDLTEILTRKPKPVVLSCRRQRDGGAWTGSEDERLTLLRQCIVGKADYVEIELDVADQIRRFPPAKRVITYTNLQETPSDIADIYAECQTKSPDVIKLVTQARTPEEAWPLVQILSKQTIPTVVVGLGKAGVMLSVLGKKIGAPWTYAALERGMEAYPGQPTVHALREVYHYAAIEKGTRLIGVTGFGETEYATVAVLNAALASQGLKARAWPVGVGSVPLFRKIMDAVHLGGVVVDEEHRTAMLGIASKLEHDAEEAHAVDLLLPEDNGWHGYNTYSGAMLTALEALLAKKFTGDNPLHSRMVMLVGANAATRTFGLRAKQRGAMLTVASHQKQAAQKLAQELECRFVQFEALYSTMHDILVIGDEEREHHKVKKGPDEPALHPGYLRANMAVIDLSTSAHLSPFLKAATARGCLVVSPRQLLREHLLLLAKMLTGKDIPRELVQQTLDAALPEET